MDLRKLVLAALLLVTQTSFAFSKLDPNNQRVRPDSLSKPCTQAMQNTTTAPVANQFAANNAIQPEVGFQAKTRSGHRGY